MKDRVTVGEMGKGEEEHKERAMEKRQWVEGGKQGAGVMGEKERESSVH